MNLPLSYQNQLKLLVDGDEAFKNILHHIKTAKKSVYANVFIWRDDKIGNIIAKALLRAAERGVQVTISKDRLGSVFEKGEENKQSFFHKGFDTRLLFQEKIVLLSYHTLRKSIRSIQKTNPLVQTLLEHKNIHIDKKHIKKDHSKYFIFDDNIIITGGVNIEDRQVFPDITGKLWNDYMIELKGKLFVKLLQKRLQGKINQNTNSWFDFVANSKHHFELKQAILALLSSAKKEIKIIMAYLGDPDITKKLIEMSNTGIDITLLAPQKANIQNDLNYKIMKHLLTKSDIKICLSKYMIHAKMIFIDDAITLVGSANLNKQTMKQLCELNILVKGKNLPFTQDVRQSITKHLQNSTLITDPSILQYRFWKSFLEDLIC